MNVCGPSFVKIKDGKTCNKYLVSTQEYSPFQIKSVCYYFDSKDDAELYYMFLLQEEGERNIKQFLAYGRNPAWEKLEMIEFRDSIDWQKLKDEVKDIQFIKEVKVFVRGKK